MEVFLYQQMEEPNWSDKKYEPKIEAILFSCYSPNINKLFLAGAG